MRTPILRTLTRGAIAACAFAAPAFAQEAPLKTSAERAEYHEDRVEADLAAAHAKGAANKKAHAANVAREKAALQASGAADRVQDKAAYSKYVQNYDTKRAAAAAKRHAQTQAEQAKKVAAYKDRVEDAKSPDADRDPPAPRG